jgi:hypothetical protein
MSYEEDNSICGNNGHNDGMSNSKGESYDFRRNN